MPPVALGFMKGPHSSSPAPYICILPISLSPRVCTLSSQSTNIRLLDLELLPSPVWCAARSVSRSGRKLMVALGAEPRSVRIAAPRRAPRAEVSAAACGGTPSARAAPACRPPSASLRSRRRSMRRGGGLTASRLTHIYTQYLFFWPAVVSMALVMLLSAQALSVVFSIALSSLKRHPGRSNGSAQHLKS